jgi:hypothetical protein
MVWKHVRGFARDLAGLVDCIADENDPRSALCRHLHSGDEKLIWRLGYLHNDNAAATGVVLCCEENGVKFVAPVCSSVVGV